MKRILNKALKKDLEKYYIGISKQLPYNKGKKLELLKIIRNDIESYITENSVTSIKEIIKQFGIAENFLDCYAYDGKLERRKEKFYEKIISNVFPYFISYLFFLLYKFKTKR